MGSPEPWAVVLPPTLTCLGRSMNRRGRGGLGPGVLTSFPALRFDAPGEWAHLCMGMVTLLPKLLVPWLDFPSISLPLTRPCSPGPQLLWT